MDDYNELPTDNELNESLNALGYEFNMDDFKTWWHVFFIFSLSKELYSQYNFTPIIYISQLHIYYNILYSVILLLYT